MIIVRPSAERGLGQESWLESRHTFSFHTYQDPRHTGFRDLRVINEDRVQPGHGFGMHPHADMEIFSLVLAGALEHADDLGNREVIGPYQMQKITAGTGIRHSERNPSASEEVHFLQVWIRPERDGLEPGYALRDFSQAPANRLTPILTPDGRDGSARLYQDASVYLARLDKGLRLDYGLRPERHAWVQVISGRLEANETSLQTGDGAAVSEAQMIRLSTPDFAELLLFDLT